MCSADSHHGVDLIQKLTKLSFNHKLKYTKKTSHEIIIFCNEDKWNSYIFISDDKGLVYERITDCRLTFLPELDNNK